MSFLAAPTHSPIRVLMLAIRYDVDDWATGFIPEWVTRLAAQPAIERLDVLALHVGDMGSLPSNVRVFSMGKEGGAGRVGLLTGFYRHALRLIPQCDAVFVHMIPRYVLLAAPLALLFRKPMTLWYTHRNPSTDLRRALPLVHRVVTAVPTSFPLQTDKLRVLGHGIDTQLYAPNPEIQPTGPASILHVARLQSIKNQDKLIAAMHHVENAQAVIVGDVPDGEDRAYPAQLHALAAPLGERVQFTGGLPADVLRGHTWRASVAVNLSPPGLFDKAALEAMACGVPTLVSNPAFDDLLGTDVDRLQVSFPPEPKILAEKLNTLLALPEDERRAIGGRLRERVVAAHSLDALMPHLAHVLQTGELPGD